MISFSRRQFYSVLIAAFFWAVIVTAFVFIPLKTAVEEPVYKEIRIQLAPMEEKQPVPEPVKTPEPEPVIEEVVAVVSEPASTPVPKTAEPAPAPKAAEPAPAPAAAEKAETPPSAPKAAEPVPAPAAKTPTPAPEPAKQTLVKSVDQLMAEQAASKGSKKSADEVDWDAIFGESSSSASSVSTGEKTFVAQQGPSTSGQAAASTTDAGTSAAAVSGRRQETAVSAGTADALGSISDAAAAGISGSSGKSAAGSGNGTVSGGSGTAAGASSGDGIEWGSGGGRKLVRPSKPEITFSEEQKALITASVRDIRISFKVRADGNVLRDSIIIDKKASLPALISQEIERQISEWTFETGTSDGQAVFLYSIIKE